MSSDADQPIGYAAAFETYFKLGWKSPLPLPHKAKKSPPAIKCHRAKFADHPVGCKDCVSYTGYGAIEPSYPDLLAWADSFRDGNLCLRLPNNDEIALVGIDVDAYGAKTGAAAFVEAVKRWGPLPQSPRSSSRAGDLTSGIRIFRVPAGTVLETKINFPSLGIGDIEVIQAHHRYVNAWPSIHPEGGHYNWRDEYDNLVHIPAPTDFPDLPARWIEGLKVVPRSQIDGPLDFNIRQAMTGGVPSTTVQERLMQAVRELQVPGASRHDTCTKHVMAIARLGKSGEPGVKQALQLLCDVLIAARAVDKSGTEQETRGEFLRMLTNDNIARELSRPGVTDWVAMLVADNLTAAPDHGAQRSSELSPAPPGSADDSGPSTAGGAEVERPETVTNADGSGAVLVDDSRPSSILEPIEEGFWQSRESLENIYSAALGKMCSPWAVLAGCAGRSLALVRPHITLPDLIGGRGSLNWFAAITARSGGGKGAALAVAKQLVPQFVYQRNLGSGEGLVTQYQAKPDTENPEGIRESVMFVADEIDNVSALGSRSGSTLLGTLRSAFSGESLGFAYATKGRDFHLEAHGYRLIFICSVQPRRAGALLNDDAGGTPQRFMWFPGTDSRIRRPIGKKWISPLSLPSLNEWMYPTELQVPAILRDTIIDERAKAMNEQQDALDGHALYCREKFSFALAVIDGRTSITEEDWELSGIASNISTFVREQAIQAIKAEVQEDAVARGELRGVEMEAAEVEKLQAQIRRGERVLRWLLHKLDAAGSKGLRQGELSDKVAGRDRATLTGILSRGHETLDSKLIDGAVVWYRR